MTPVFDSPLRTMLACAFAVTAACSTPAPEPAEDAPAPAALPAGRTYAAHTASPAACERTCAAVATGACAAFGGITAGIGGLACGFASIPFCYKACTNSNPIKISEGLARECLLKQLPAGSRAKLMGIDPEWSAIKFEVSNVHTRDGHVHTGHAAIMRTYAGPQKVMMSWRIGVHHVRPLSEVDCPLAVIASASSVPDWSPSAPPPGTPPVPPADTTPPTVSLAPPIGGLDQHGVISVTANAADDGGAVAVELAIDDNPFATLAAPPFAAAWDTASVPDGLHTLTATARDPDGNAAASAVQIVVDNTPPSTAITSPAAGTWQHGSVTVAAIASDNRGVAAVDFYADGQLFASRAAPPYEVSWDSVQHHADAVTFQTIARDLAGNTGASSAVVVNIDNTPAVVTLNKLGWDFGGGYGVAQDHGPFTISGWATDAHLAEVKAYVNGALVAVFTTPQFSMPWGAVDLPEGRYDVKVVATDSSGNVGEALQSIVIDTSPPVAHLASPADHTVLTRSDATLMQVVGFPGPGPVDFVTSVDMYYRYNGIVRLIQRDIPTAQGGSWKSIGFPPDVPNNVDIELYAVATDIFGRTTTTGVTTVRLMGNSCESEVSFIMPTMFQHVSGPSMQVEVPYWLKCGSGIESIVFTLDDQLDITGDPGFPFRAELPLFFLPPNTYHTVTATVRANNGYMMSTSRDVFLGD